MKGKRKVRDSDLRNVEAALRRSAEAARRIARSTQTPLVVWENGKVVEKRMR